MDLLFMIYDRVRIKIGTNLLLHKNVDGFVNCVDNSSNKLKICVI